MPSRPQTPPSLPEKRKRNPEDDESSSDSSVDPSLPPNSQRDSSPKRARIIGPSLPPSIPDKLIGSGNPNQSKDASDSSDDDDDFGPSLPPPNGTGSQRIDTSGSVRNPTSTIAAAPEVKRDDWMTVAPTGGDWSARVDPTKLKNRKFNTGRGAKAPPSSAAAGGDTWYETPAEKQARLQREILGIKEKPIGGSAKSDNGSRSEVDAATAKRLKEYNKARGPTLYEAHQKGHKVEEEDDPSARAFDREKDIAGGLQINSTQRRDMLKKASDFNSRFSSAKYL